MSMRSARGSPWRAGVILARDYLRFEQQFRGWTTDSAETA